MHFDSVLYLDDMRTPLILGMDVVRSYNEFVWFLREKPVPQLISLDHDLAFNHYALEEENPSLRIPYESYTEKTGWHCAKWIVENRIPIQFWHVHSFNPIGKMNIEHVLRAYCPQGEVRDLKIPYSITEMAA